MLIIVAGVAFWQFRPKPLTLRPVDFKQLPGWETADATKSFRAFQTSCTSFLSMDPEQAVGSDYIPMKAKDWQAVCTAAQKHHSPSEREARRFFQTWFTPVAFYERSPLHGLFTGYYLPYLQGSLKQTKDYTVPIYGLPSNLVTINLEDFGKDLGNRRLIGRREGNKIVPYQTREEINKGALKNLAQVIVWVNNPIDHFFLQVEGSGIVGLPEGNILHLGYAGANGASYTSIGKILVQEGTLSKTEASMQGIKAYLEAHPEKIESILNQNKSYVFFRILENDEAIGTEGVPLTPGYSLAVDQKWIPLGAPLWLDTTMPGLNNTASQPLQRLMIAQDTGGAIRGVVRGDVFWGAGDEATYIAGKMNNQGRYWLLLPRRTSR